MTHPSGCRIPRRHPAQGIRNAFGNTRHSAGVLPHSRRNGSRQTDRRRRRRGGGLAAPRARTVPWQQGRRASPKPTQHGEEPAAAEERAQGAAEVSSAKAVQRQKILLQSDLDHFKRELEAFALGRPAPPKLPAPPGDPLVPHVAAAKQFGVTPRSVDRWVGASEAQAEQAA
jgi:hypothetical protein